MGLVKCPECGREISDKATACPGCGCPIGIERKVNTQKEVQPAVKKKHSTLSCIACVFAGVAILAPMIKILGVLLSLVGLIIGAIDLCINDKNKKHLGSWFAIVVFALYFFVVIM